MKTIISPMCFLALMSGIAMAAPDYTMFKPYRDTPVTHYRRPLAPVCPAIEREPRNITTDLALQRRAKLWRKSLAIAQAEAVFYPSTPARVSGLVSAQRVPQPQMVPVPVPVPVPAEQMPMEAPPPPPGFGGPQGSAIPMPMRPPAMPENGQIPTAQAVQGKPGFVVSPYDPVTGLIDVSGMAPGSEMRDPYTGRPFRIP